MALLTLRLFGEFRASLGERRLSLPTKKAHALLAYLAVRPGQAYLRDKLSAVFWSGVGKKQARHSLRQSLSALRRALLVVRPQILVVQGERVALHASSVDIDVVAFERLARRDTLRSLEQAAALYAGDLLDGIDISEEPFEEWLSSERARLRETAVNVLT